jgi:SAM-dependent methyltransferase
MMQAYGKEFAQAYNLRWTHFANTLAPRILEFYERSAGEALLAGPRAKTLLDVCCGTGQLACYFVERGYTVTGVDLSEGMLSYARDNAAAHVQAGRARFIQANATDFTLDEPVGLAVSTFDALNHLPDMAALQSCFARVHAALVEGGLFIFDLNTRAGLRRWNSIGVEDTDEMMIVNRGIYVEAESRAWALITGFVRNAGGLYQRFEETAYNTAFDLAQVRAALLESGWRDCYFARSQDFGSPLAEPEQEGRAFIVARK